MPGETKLKTVLLVDDEEPFLLSLVDGLRPYGGRFRAVTALDGTSALEVVGRVEVDLVVTDLRMPGMDGFALLAALQSDHPHIPSIVISAYNSPETEARLLTFAPCACLEKPVDLGDLVAAILRALGVPENHAKDPALLPRSGFLVPLIFGLLATFWQLVSPAGQAPRVDWRSSSGAPSPCGRVWR